jgi:hypothetical protein
MSLRSINQDDTNLYLPIVFRSDFPDGSYFCYEYEFGLIWTTEVITLSPDGSSVYDYGLPYAAIVTGTWAYTASEQVVEFTNFRWLTATYEMSNRLWASRYLPQAGFEIALSCHRQ